MKALMIPSLAKKKDYREQNKQKSAALEWTVKVTNWIQNSVSGVKSLTYKGDQWLKATLYAQEFTEVWVS